MGSPPHDFQSSAGQAFIGTVRTDSLQDILISDFTCDPCEVRVTPRNIAASDCDDFILCVQLDRKSTRLNSSH